MNNIEFKITGVPFKTELKISLFFGLCFVLLWTLPIYLYCSFNHSQGLAALPSYIFWSSMLLGLGCSLIIARILGKKMRQEYTFDISDNGIKVYTKTNPLSDIYSYKVIELISLVGTAESMRFFKIESNQEKLRIRLGTYGLAPFSESRDIQTMDSMITEIEKKTEKKGFITRKINAPNKAFEYRFMNPEYQ